MARGILGAKCRAATEAAARDVPAGALWRFPSAQNRWFMSNGKSYWIFFFGQEIPIRMENGIRWIRKTSQTDLSMDIGIWFGEWNRVS